MNEYNKKVARIEKVETDTAVKDGTEFIKVDVQVIDPNYVPEFIKDADGNEIPNADGQVVPVVVERRSFGYKIETTENEITKSIKKFIDEYNREKEQLVKDKKNIEARKRVTKTITNLTNGVIK